MQGIPEYLREIVAKAAIASFPFIGTGSKNEGDQAAVDAMRAAFEGKDMDAIVRVGEGEKDNAPMLYVGERLGTGRGTKLDIAVDPIEGTSLMAAGKPNAISVIAASEQDAFWEAGHAYYMDKIVVGRQAKDVIDIRASVAENLHAIARAKGKSIADVSVYVLNKPRHIKLRAEIAAIGANVALHDEGDVIGSAMALMDDSGIDVLMGIGGAPEAVITAAAVKALGGGMQGRLAPQKEDELENLQREGVDLAKVYQLDDFIRSDYAVFAAAGVTTGPLLQGVEVSETSYSTEVIVIDSSYGVSQEIVIYPK